jgi:energy-coupling factor transport system permease protein
MLGVFAVHHVIGIIFLFGTISLLFPLAGIPLQVLWRNTRAFFWLYVITFLIHLFFHPGRALVTVPLIGWQVTFEGIEAGVLFTVRIAVLVSLSLLLMSITTPQELTDGLEKLLRPLTRLKVPVSEGALMVSIALRFVPILTQEALKIQRAQTARGADLEGSWVKRIRKTLPMILPLFTSALKKADDLALALEARAYRGGQGRTQMMALSIAGRDMMAFVLTGLLTAGLVILG